ncbi:hypothetical protein SAY86_026034 [Trapa natans]|uniref:SHSP domain-containing protein n=1 Tax=Trapa natans TaxID=22666 RepID=A0AAN7QED0_TRANT|nr:hypothetical protein SAY86_026034 [Trapa natans]
MALARLALRNLPRVQHSPSIAPMVVGQNLTERTRAELAEGSLRLMSTKSATEKASDDKDVAASDGGSRNRGRFCLNPRRNRLRSLWRDDDPDFAPALYGCFPSGLNSALMQATNNINRLFQSMKISPWQLAGRVKEKDDHYKIRYDLPGLSKEDVRVTVHDGVLSIMGEQKKEEEEGEEGSEGEWSTASYSRYYNTSLMLPEDARTDQIRAELKDGVLCITVSKAEKPKKDVKEVQVL